MEESKELAKIKKLYGEKFMRFCRELFPTLLEKEGLLTEILTSTFATNSRTLYEDIKRQGLTEIFKNYIYKKSKINEDEIYINLKKTPFELFKEQGYTLYECTTEDEIQKFKKYYTARELLCTFNGGRLNYCLVFFAVKDDADKIKREDFRNPKREDEYGSSVMSIQFTIGKSSTVSIKSRYNHTVSNPDAMYSNNLEKIAPGLTQSFKELLGERGIDLSTINIKELELMKYTVANDGKYYKYNSEVNGIYYCPGNTIIKNGNVIHLETEKKILIDYFIVDLQNKKIDVYDTTILDNFIGGFGKIESIAVKRNEEKGSRTIVVKSQNMDEPTIIDINTDNKIIGYTNNNIENINDYFLCGNVDLKRLELKKVRGVGNKFLLCNEKLENLSMPKLKIVGDFFLFDNKNLTELDLPDLIEVGKYFILNNRLIKRVNLHKLKYVGANFLERNEELEELILPSLREADVNFLVDNQKIHRLEMPKLEVTGYNFLLNNLELEEVEFPILRKTNHYFMNKNEKLKKAIFPELSFLEIGFMGNNRCLNHVEMPSLTKVEATFMKYNPLKEIVPKILTENKNQKLTSLYDVRGTNNISSNNIAVLDREMKITSNEVVQAKGVIEKMRQKSKEEEKTNDD